jgi:hypothetical protein
MRKILSYPLTPLLLFSLTLAAVLMTYLALGLTPSPSLQVVASFGWTLLLAMWIVSDAQRRQALPCYDFGFLCYLFLPVIAPAYCFWSRGWRGVLMLTILASTWIAPYIVATLMWWAIYR